MKLKASWSGPALTNIRQGVARAGPGCVALHSLRWLLHGAVHLPPGCVAAARQPAGLKVLAPQAVVVSCWCGLGKADRDASGLARATQIVVGPGGGGGGGEPCPGVVHADSPARRSGCGLPERRPHFAEWDLDPE